MISIDLSETAQKSALEIRDKIQSETTSENFFSNKIIFSDKKKNSWILSWTEFVLEGILPQTEFCLGLHTAVVFHM